MFSPELNSIGGRVRRRITEDVSVRHREISLKRINLVQTHPVLFADTASTTLVFGLLARQVGFGTQKDCILAAQAPFPHRNTFVNVSHDFFAFAKGILEIVEKLHRRIVLDNNARWITFEMVVALGRSQKDPQEGPPSVGATGRSVQ